MNLYVGLGSPRGQKWELIGEPGAERPAISAVTGVTFGPDVITIPCFTDNVAVRFLG